MAAGYGPPRIDFGQLGDIGTTFTTAYDAARKRALLDQQQAALGELGKTLGVGGTPDYLTAGARLLPFSPELGLSLIKMGQTQQTGKELGEGLAGIFGGGRTAPVQPPTQPGTQPRADATSLGNPVAPGLEPHETALLNAISAPESRGAYNVRYTPRGGVPFEETGQHPAIGEFGPAGLSTAAGRYMFTKSTWDAITGGNVPFTRENQDIYALKLAAQDYGRRTGRDLNEDLKANGLTPQIMAALSPTWTGLRDNPRLALAAYGQPGRPEMMRPGEGGGAPTADIPVARGAETEGTFFVPPAVSGGQPTNVPASSLPPAPAPTDETAFTPRPAPPVPATLGPVPGGATGAIPQTPQSQLAANIPKLLALSLKEGLSDAQRSTVQELLKQALAESGLTEKQKDYLFSKGQGDTRSYPQWLMDIARAGATAVTTTTNVGAEKAEEAGTGKAAAEAGAELAAQGRTAQNNIARIDLLSDLLKRGTTGALGPLHAQVVGTMQGLGVSDKTIESLGLNPNQAITDQATTKIVNELMVGQIGKGGFPANNFSDADAKIILQMFPGMRNRPEANEIALEVMRRIQEQNQKKSDAWLDFKEASIEAGRPISFDRFEAQWRKQTRGERLFGDLQEKLAALPKSGQPGLGGTGTPPPVTGGTTTPPPAAPRFGTGRPPPGVPPAALIDIGRQFIAQGKDPRAVADLLASWGIAPTPLEGR